jgi:hypothetical protein
LPEFQPEHTLTIEEGCRRWRRSRADRRENTGELPSNGGLGAAGASATLLLSTALTSWLSRAASTPRASATVR